MSDPHEVGEESAVPQPKNYQQANLGATVPSQALFHERLVV